jgi:DNA primase
MVNFSEIKNRIPMRDVAEMYGITVGRNGLARCPFHDEKTASMKIYDGNRGFYCFGCGTGGDVVKFTALLFNLTNADAAKKLISDFALETIGERNQAAIKRAEEEGFRREKLRELLAIRRTLFQTQRDGTGHAQAALAEIDYVVDNYDKIKTEEVNDIVRRLSV